MVIALSVAAFLGVALAFVLFFAVNSTGSGWLARLGRRLFEVRPGVLASHQERVDTRIRLESQYRWLTEDRGKPAAFLLGEAKAAFDSTRDGIKNLDTKAGTLIGIVTTGLGAFALLGDASKIPGRTAFLYIGLALLVVALFTAVLALPTRGLPVPRLSDYALLSTLASKDNKARIQFELIEAWLSDTRAAEAIAGGKARLLLVAAFTIVLGVLSLTVNWSIGVATAPTTQPAPTAAAK